MLLLLVLLCTRVLVVGVTNFREREQIPNLFGGVWARVPAQSVIFRSGLDVAHASPFIIPKGKARVTIVVKSWKGKDERKKQKGGLGRGCLPPYPAWAVYPVAQGHNGRRAFGLSVHWCNVLWPRFGLCAFVPSRMGGACTWICVERGLGSTVAVTPVAVEAWTPSWWNDWGHVES
jgi:hypothetical protein